MANANQTHEMLPVPAPFTGRREIDLDAVREMVSHFHFDDYEEAQELILSALQEINEVYGWVSPEATEIVARHLNTTPERVFSLLTFYADFRTARRGHHHMLICHGMACYVHGSQRLVQHMQDDFGVQDGDTTTDGNMSVQVVNGCLGVCDQAPVVKIDDTYHGSVDAETLTDLVNDAVANHTALTENEETHGPRGTN
ncbi:MAG TPA: NAD(P)H-dependent oxidoreductase subunit E [Thermomicrobiales bacterium]|nr:NAD(P)H-dependent oxidoreductase subunit E [Thermomicrobiales bacterium]